MTALQDLLSAFQRATQCEVALWDRTGKGQSLRCETAAPPGAGMLPPRTLPDSGVVTDTSYAEGERLVALLAGQPPRWLTVGPCDGSGADLHKLAGFLVPAVSSYLQSALEVEHAANELAERYEEINLLYTISEILGRTVTMSEATSTILNEISATVGAQKGAILVHDRVTDTLQVEAAVGVSPLDTMPISTDDTTSVSARVFKSRHPVLVDADEMPCQAEVAYRDGAMLSVPILWTTPTGGEPLGVVNLSARRSGLFTAGDQKLVTAIASQIANAIQNSRLVRESLSQQRLRQEMELAHDLQMRLLPDASLVASDATVAARVVPAESVGGDFYNLFRLTNGRTGAMVGDVSGHGYRAALIMALAMSASAIHAQGTDDPGEMLNALRASLKEELLTTEMFISAFYGVVDRGAGVLRFANTGHPHAFVVRANGDAERLPALDPPLGMSDEFPSVCAVKWEPGEDMLLLFTDGVTDARNRATVRLGEQAVLDMVGANRGEHPEKVLELLLAMLRDHTGEATRRDDLTILLLRS